MTIAQMRESRNKLVADARAIQDKADADKRVLTADELANQRKLIDEAKDLSERINMAADLEDAEAGTGAPESQRAARGKGKAEEGKTAYVRAFTSYVRNGWNMMSGDDQRALQTGFQQFSESEQRAQSTLSGAAGGFDVAPDTSFYGKIVEAKKFFGWADAAGVTVINSSTGADLPIPTMDDTSNSGTLVEEEGSHASGTDVALGQKILHAYLLSSKIVKVSWQLLQDAENPWEALLARVFGTRLGRARATYLTTGTGVSQPQGIVTAASVGRQSATGFSTSVPFDDFIRVEHSVNKAYRPAGKYMMNDNTALAVRLLKNGNGDYIWRNGEGGQPDRINGYTVVINTDMADMAASVKHTLFGDFSFFYVRNVAGIQIVRLNELYAANGQVGFLAFERFDGGLIDAGQGPVKALQNSAS